MIIDDDWISIQELSHYTKASEWTIKRLVKSKHLAAHKVEGSVRFKINDIANWIILSKPPTIEL